MNTDKIIEELDSKSIIDKYIYIFNVLDNLDFDNKEEMRKTSIVFNDDRIKKYALSCQQINNIFDYGNKIILYDTIIKEKNNFDSELNFYYLIIAYVYSLSKYSPVFEDIDNKIAINKLNKLIRKTKLKMINYAEMQTC